MKETKNSSISLKNTGCGVFATHVALSRVTQRPVRGGADINNWPPASTGGRFPVRGARHVWRTWGRGTRWPGEVRPAQPSPKPQARGRACCLLPAVGKSQPVPPPPGHGEAVFQ